MLYEIAPKAVLYAAALIAVGVPVTRMLLIRAAGSFRPSRIVDFEARLRRLAFIAAVAALSAVAVRAWAHTAVVFGPAETVRWENLQLIALESRWGAAWRWQAAAASALFGTAAILTGMNRGWIAYGIAAVALSATLPLLGHAGGSAVRVMIHAAHLVAGGAWLGTLGATLWSALLPGAKKEHDRAIAQAVVARFSSIALVAAPIVAISGLALAVLYVGLRVEFVTTSYGQALVAKLVAVSAIVACGGLNWRRVRDGAAPSVPLIATELAFAASVVMVTSVLTELEHP